MERQLRDSLLSQGDSSVDSGVKKVHMTLQDSANFKHYMYNSSINNPAGIQAFDKVRQNMKALLYQSIRNSLKINLLLTLLLFLKFVATFAVLMLSYHHLDLLFYLLSAIALQNLLQMTHHFLLIYFMATDRTALISRVASSYRLSLLHPTSSSQGFSKTISVDQLLSSNLDHRQSLAVLKSKHSHQNIMQLQKETKIMQHDLKQSHFSNQVKHQHKSVKWLGHISNIFYGLLFIASNILLFWRPNVSQQHALYILLIVHLVYGYLLLVIIGLLLLTTALASPFILTAFLYRKYHSHIKSRHTMKVLSSLPLEEYSPVKHPEPKCTICLAPFLAQQQLHHLRCFHYFHQQCLHQWFLVSPQCPICRDDYSQTPQIV